MLQEKRESDSVAETPPTTDSDPRAKYFRQAGNGLYVRMGMLDGIMKSLP
jgi:aspartate carbamoyltransferase catalytic subunit